LYASGEISLHEFERCAELILDDEAERIRNDVEGVNGVAPETSASIALEFDSLEDVESGSREELEDVHGIGGVNRRCRGRVSALS
jgi:ERCC4-type nuclease